MNILILTTHLNKGGISRYSLNLAKGLSLLEHKVWIASSGGEWLNKARKAKLNHKFIPINTKSICSIKILLSFFSLGRFIRRQAIEIIHCNTRVTQFLGFLIYKYFGIPYLSTFHGFYRPTVFRKAFQFSGVKAIAVSKAVKEHLANDLNINSEKIAVVYNGLDLNEFQASGAKRSDWNFTAHDFLIGILGRISEEKGHFLAAQAIGKLLPKYPNLQLVVSGEGKLKVKFEEFIRASGLKPKVHFINCGANKFLDIIDLLLVPSKKEGFGYSIIEAFLKETPVIGYAVGGIKEIIQNERNGILFSNYNSLALAEAIEKLILKKELRLRITKAAKEDALNFSIEKMAINTERIYWSVLP